MRRTAVQSLLRLCAVAVVIAGCGDEPRQDAPRPAPDAVVDCAKAGIGSRSGRQGTCSTGGVVRTVVDRGRPLSLPGDFEVRLTGVTAGRGVVRVGLAVTNLSNRTFRWPSHRPQIALYFRDRLIAQTAGVRPRRLAAGRSRELTATWRLGVDSARALRRRGTAVIVVPPSEARQGARSVGESLRIGVLRLWK